MQIFLNFQMGFILEENAADDGVPLKSEVARSAGESSYAEPVDPVHQKLLEELKSMHSELDKHIRLAGNNEKQLDVLCTSLKTFSFYAATVNAHLRRKTMPKTWNDSQRSKFLRYLIWKKE